MVHDCITLESSRVGNRCPPQIIMTCTGIHCVRQPLRVHRQHATLDVRATCTSNAESTAAKEFPLDSTRALGAVNASCRTGQTHCVPPAYHRTAQRGGVGLPCPIVNRSLQHQRLTVLEKPYIQRVRAQAPAMLRSCGDWSIGMCRSLNIASGAHQGWPLSRRAGPSYLPSKKRRPCSACYMRWACWCGYPRSPYLPCRRRTVAWPWRCWSDRRLHTEQKF